MESKPCSDYGKVHGANGVGKNDGDGEAARERVDESGPAVSYAARVTSGRHDGL